MLLTSISSINELYLAVRVLAIVHSPKQGHEGCVASNDAREDGSSVPKTIKRRRVDVNVGKV